MKPVTLIIEADEDISGLKLTLESINRNTKQEHDILIISSRKECEDFGYDCIISDTHDKYLNWNIGLEKAETETVCFMQTGMIVTPGWLTGLMGSYQEYTNSLIVPKVSTNNQGWAEYLQLIYLDKEPEEIIELTEEDNQEYLNTDFSGSVNRPWLINRELFQKIGGWMTTQPEPAGMDLETIKLLKEKNIPTEVAKSHVFIYHCYKVTFPEQATQLEPEPPIEPGAQANSQFQPLGIMESRFSLKPMDKARVFELQTELVGYLYRHVPAGGRWMGYGMQQWISDLYHYQDLMWMVKPTVVIESGTGGGGVPLFLNDILTLMEMKGLNEGPHKIITMDIIDNHKEFPEEVIFLNGDSIELFQQVQEMITGDDIVVVLLDSAHNHEHVYQEMELYGQLVTPGSYMVVQDTGLDLAHLDNLTGPLAAVKKYLGEHNDFDIDNYFDRWIITQHPFGWLKKKE